MTTKLQMKERPFLFWHVATSGQKKKCFATPQRNKIYKMEGTDQTILRILSECAGVLVSKAESMII